MIVEVFIIKSNSFVANIRFVAIAIISHGFSVCICDNRFYFTGLGL